MWRLLLGTRVPDVAKVGPVLLIISTHVATSAPSPRVRNSLRRGAYHTFLLWHIRDVMAYHEYKM